MRTRIKICCIASHAEAATAIAAGADALGLVARMPSGPGTIDDALIAAIAGEVPPAVATFLLTAETGAEGIIEHARRCRTDTIQLVDRVEPAVHAQVRRALPALRLVQVIHVVDEASVAEAVSAASQVHALLLDSGNPGLEVKELGGTGRIHDWSLSRRIRDSVDRPLFLAGGLTAENVAAAIRQVEPFGVDLCSGVRTDGRLDPIKLEKFVAAVRTSQRQS